MTIRSRLNLAFALTLMMAICTSAAALPGDTQKALDANKAVVRRYFDAFNGSRFAQLGEIVSATYGDRLEGQASGIDVLTKYLRGLKSSFPDIHWKIGQIVAEGDRVAVMNRITGTQKRDFAGIKASGRSIDIEAFQIYRIENGKLAEHWEVADFAKLQKQLSGQP